MTTIPEVLRNGAERWSAKTAVDICGDRLSYSELLVESERRARGLAALGLKPGDRICTMLDNNIDAVLVTCGANLLGAVTVPLNTALKGEFLRHQIVDSDARAIVAEGDYVSRLADIKDDIPLLSNVVHRGAVDLSFPSVRLLPLAELLTAQSADPLNVAIAPNDVAMLLYTSGTTGPSKGCIIGHNYICNMGRVSAVHTGISASDVYWTPCPLYHIGALGGTLLGGLQLGATIAIAERFSLSNFWPEIERTGATVSMLLSMMLNLVAAGPETEASRRCYGQMHTVMGLPFPETLQNTWKERFGVKWTGPVGYGLTEAVSITIRSLREPAPADASGKRFPDYDVRIFSDDDRECPAGVPGEIVVRPTKPGIMFQGYWKQPEATVSATRNLWFHTGDIGRFDENGYLYFVDRKKDYLRRGGENISSYELELALRAHPAIEDVACYGVPSERSEDEVKIAVVLRKGVNLSEEQLCRWSLERLPHFAIPRYIEFRAAFPRNGVGRVQKYQLRNEPIDQNTWDRLTSDIKIQKR